LVPFTHRTTYGYHGEITGLKHSERKGDSLLRRSLKDILQKGAKSSSAPSSGVDAISEHAVEVSAKCRDKPVARYLPEVTLVTSLSGASSSGTPAEGGARYI
jgi:hypothetical protein